MQAFQKLFIHQEHILSWLKCKKNCKERLLSLGQCSSPQGITSVSTQVLIKRKGISWTLLADKRWNRLTLASTGKIGRKALMRCLGHLLTSRSSINKLITICSARISHREKGPKLQIWFLCHIIIWLMKRFVRTTISTWQIQLSFSMKDTMSRKHKKKHLALNWKHKH